MNNINNDEGYNRNLNEPKHLLNYADIVFVNLIRTLHSMDVWTYGRMDLWTYGRMDKQQ